MPMPMRLLRKLFEIHSPSGHEHSLKKYIHRHIRKNVGGCKVWFDKKGNMYIKKGEAANYPCMVAHLDQVQQSHPKDFMTVQCDDIIFGYSPKERDFKGLGADDKVGIWIALQCLEKYDAIKLAFFVEEETGCLGSENADMSFFDDARFVVQCDRRGNSDMITTIGWTDLCSSAFIKAIEPQAFGYRKQTGMMTDVEALKERGLGVSCINLSCGYYRPHTDNEFVVISDILKCKAFVEHIIETVKEPSPHIARDIYLGVYDDTLDELFDIVDYALSYNPKLTATELHEFYHGDYPHATLEQFEEAVQQWKCFNEPCESEN